MDSDQLIYQAFSNTPIQGEGVFILEGDPNRRMIRVRAADQAYKDGLMCFQWSIQLDFMFLGIFTEEKDANIYMDCIQEGVDKDLLIQSKTLFIVEGNPVENELRVVSCAQAFRDNLNYYEMNMTSGFIYMGIFVEERLAHNHITIIRERLRNEAGDRLI